MRSLVLLEILAAYGVVMFLSGCLVLATFVADMRRKWRRSRYATPHHTRGKP